VCCTDDYGVVVRGVPWWGVVSSAAAPVLMVSGWTVAAGLQPRSFDDVAQPVSALAAVGAADRWVMTLTFLVVGACDFVTGLALRPARGPGRLILMAGAVAGVLVAANPEQPGTRFPLPHMIWAAAGCVALVAWPAGAWRRGRSVPWGLRPAVSAGAVAVLLALLAWFGAELITGGGEAGLAERIFGAAQALWPLAVVVSCRRAARAGTRSSRSAAGLAAKRTPAPGQAAGAVDLPGVLATAGRARVRILGALAFQRLAELALDLFLGTFRLRRGLSHVDLLLGRPCPQLRTCDTGTPPGRVADSDRRRRRPPCHQRRRLQAGGWTGSTSWPS
jgi:hypothetical protein